MPGRGPAYDTFALLSTALGMAGKTNFFELTRPPLIPFILSLFFRTGLTTEMVVYALEGFFYILGGVGLFLLLRRRISPLFSLCGALLFLTFPDVVVNVGFGATDIMAISLSIWLLYIMVLGAEKDERFLWFVFPLFLLTFFTRFTAAVMLFPVVFYLLLRTNLLRRMKALSISLLAAGSILALDMYYYWGRTKGEALYQFVAPLAVASTVELAPGATLSNPTGPSTFFISRFGDFLSGVGSGVGWLLAAVSILGLILTTVYLFQKRKRTIISSVLMLAVIAAGCVFLIFSKINFLAADFIIVAVFLFLIPRFFELDEKRVLDLMVLVWFLCFLCYHSHQLVKTTRYFITMAPAVAYFIVVGLYSAASYTRRVRSKLVYPIVACALVIMIIVAASMSGVQSYNKVLAMKPWGFASKSTEAAAEWLKPKLKTNSIVYADFFVAAAWYLKRPIQVMPSFKDPRGVNQELEKYHADYFLSIYRSEDTHSYKMVKKFGRVRIFARKTKPAKHKESMFIVGRDIDHYLEDVLDFKYYIVRRKSGFPGDSSQSIGNTYLDDYTIGELGKYPVLLLYNFKWRNFENAENLVERYVRNGGTVVIDASGNSGNSFYDLNNGSFMGTMVYKKLLSKDAQVSILSEFRNATNVDTNRFGSFVDELGEPWAGSTYQDAKTISNQTLDVLATANNKNLVCIQKTGKGRVIWIGFNFVFHSFLKENEEEQKLVRDIFDIAFQESPPPQESEQLF